MSQVERNVGNAGNVFAALVGAAAKSAVATMRPNCRVKLTGDKSGGLGLSFENDDGTWTEPTTIADIIFTPEALAIDAKGFAHVPYRNRQGSPLPILVDFNMGFKVGADTMGLTVPAYLTKAWELKQAEKVAARRR